MRHENERQRELPPRKGEREEFAEAYALLKDP